MMKQTPREALFMRLHPYKGEPPLRWGFLMMKQTPREALFMRLHPYKGEPPLRRGIPYDEADAARSVFHAAAPV